MEHKKIIFSSDIFHGHKVVVPIPKNLNFQELKEYIIDYSIQSLKVYISSKNLSFEDRLFDNIKKTNWDIHGDDFENPEKEIYICDCNNQI